MKKYLTSTIIACFLCLIIGFGTACSCSEVQIKELYFDNTTIDLVVGDTLDCSVEGLGLYILPNDATEQKINFIITKEDKSKDNKRVQVLNDTSKPKIVAANPGVAVITARTADGAHIASITVRVFEKNFKLSAPTGITYDSTNQRVTWDEKQYLISDKYNADEAHTLNEVFYEVELNGQVVETTNKNYFENFNANQVNNVKVRAVTKPQKSYIGSSAYTSAVSFKVLEAPQSLELTQEGLTWEAVEGANSYNVVVYERDASGNLTVYNDIKDITQTTYALDIEKAGNFVVEVKAVPAENNSNIYTSKASNQISIKKYDEVQSLTIEDDMLIWNSVVGAEEYNIVLIDKSTSAQSKINVRPSNVNEEFISYDLSKLNIAGTYIAKIETISNYSIGLNSKVSTLEQEFIKLNIPQVDRIENNILYWTDFNTQEDIKVLVKIGDWELNTPYDNFTLPEEVVAGTYDLFFKACGNGSNIISSVWSTNAYQATKLQAPSTLTHEGYHFTIGEVENATSYELFDTCDEFGDVVEVEQKLIDANTNTYLISVANKVSSFGYLYQNKYTIKAQAKADGYFYSNLSDVSVSFYKMLPLASVVVQEITITNEQGVPSGYISININRGDVDLWENSALNGPILQSIKVGDVDSYYRILVEVFRVVGQVEDLYQTYISSSSSQLSLSEMYDLEGGNLIFKASFYGNNDTVLSSDAILFVTSTNDILVMKKVYEPIDLNVTDNTLSWGIVAVEGVDSFVIKNQNGQTIYNGATTYTDSVRENILITNQLYDFTIQNMIGSRSHAIYWADSKVVHFQAGILDTPNIAFNGYNIEWQQIDNASTYYVYVNDEKVDVELNQNNGKVYFDYIQAFNTISGQLTVKVIASCGANSEDLWFNSDDSNELVINNIAAERVEVQNNKISIKPNMFNVDAKLNFTLIKVEDEQVYNGYLDYDATTERYVFDIYSYVTEIGYYNIKFNFEYSGAQGNQIRYIVFDECEITNIVVVPESLEPIFNTQVGTNAPILSWAAKTNISGYKILVRDISTANLDVVATIDINDINVTSYNLSYIKGLHTTSQYQFAVIAVGSGENATIVELNNAQTVYQNTTSFAYKLNTLTSFLAEYNGDDYFSIIGEIQGFASTIVGNTITLSWQAEEGVEYEVYVNDGYVSTQDTNVYEYNFDPSTEVQVDFKVRGKTKLANANIFASTFTRTITIQKLETVTDLTAEGYLTFNHTEENLNFLIEVYDESNASTLVYTTQTSERSVNLSEVAALEANHTFTIHVQALGNGVDKLQSTKVGITNVNFAGALTLGIDSTNCVFYTNNNSPYVIYFASRYDNGDFVEQYSSDIMENDVDAVWDISTIVPQGKYKVWASSLATANGEGAIFGKASNYLYVEVLATVTNLRIENNKIVFTPLETYDTYLINIDGTLNTVTVADLDNDYIYATNLLDVAGEHDISIRTKGNYDVCEDLTFASTVHSPYTPVLQVTRLALPDNITLEDNVLTFDEVENAQKYQITFSCLGKDDIVVEVINNSLNLYDVEFEEGTYSCVVKAIGNNEENILDSLPVALLENVVVTSNEDVTLTLSATNKRLEWNSVTTSYGYLVYFYDTNSNQTTLVNTENNYLVVPSTISAGEYKITVRANGNGANILPGKLSNEITITKLNSVQNVRKSQTQEQDALSKAYIVFDTVSQTQSYRVIIKKPDGTYEAAVEYANYNSSNPYEYIFTDAGEYEITVIAVGNYLTTVDSNEQTITITKLDKPQDLTFTYGAVVTDNNTIQLETILSWTKEDFDTNVSYQYQYNVFGSAIVYDNVVVDNDKTRIYATFNISAINTLDKTVKVRFAISYNNANYISGDWRSIELYIYKPATITGIQTNKLYFEFDNEDSAYIANVEKMVVYAINTQTQSMVSAKVVDYTVAGELNIEELVQSLSVGQYSIGVYALGNGGIYLASQASELFDVDKLMTPNISLQKGVDDGDYNTYLTWEGVQSATSYLIMKNGEQLTTISDTYYLIDGIVQSAGNTATSFEVYAIGDAGTVISSVSNEIIVKPTIIDDFGGEATNSIIFSGGYFDLSAYSDYLQDYKIIAVILGNQYLVQNEYQFDLPDNLIGGQNYTIKFKLVPNNYILQPEIDNVSGETLYNYYPVNSLFTADYTYYRIANLDDLIISQGYLTCILPTLQNVEIGSNVFIEACWGTTVVYTSTPYSEGLPVRLDVPTVSVPYTNMTLKYRVLGNEENISSAYHYFDIVNPVALLASPTCSFGNDYLSWQAVENAASYELQVVCNVIINGEAYDAGSFEDICFNRISLDKDTLSYNIQAIVNSVYEADNLFTWYNGSPVTININPDADLQIIVKVYALGDSDKNNNGTTYLTNNYTKVNMVKYSTPFISCKDGDLWLYKADEQSAPVQVDIDGDLYVVLDQYNREENINKLFLQDGTYTVRMRFYADSLNDFDIYTISSDWTDYVTVNKMPTVTDISINDKGFLTFVADFTSFDSLSVAQFQAAGAYQKILVDAGVGKTQVTEVKMTYDSINNKVIGTTYLSDAYLQGYLDFLNSGLSKISISILGGNDEYLADKYLISSSFGVKQDVNKLTMPNNFNINNYIASWDAVSNASGYVIIVATTNGEQTAAIKVDGTSYNLLNNANFPAGTYQIVVRALGNENFLCSSATTNIEFKVYATPTVAINDGYVVITFADGAQVAGLSGKDVTNNRTFEATYDVSDYEIINSNQIRVELPDDIVNDIGIFTYELKFKFMGDGSETIDSFYTSTITVQRLSQINYVSSYQGKVMWAPINFGSGVKVTEYIIKVANMMNEETFTVNVTDADLQGDYYAVDIPPSIVLAGNVSVYVKAKGSRNNATEYINGAYSNALSAYKFSPNVSIGANNAGELTWSTIEANVSGFTLIIYTNVLNVDDYIENASVITTTSIDVPEQITLKDSTVYTLVDGIYTMGVKLIGQQSNNVHYLSTFSNTVEVQKLQQTSQFVISDGQLMWRAVENAKFYELSFTYEDVSTSSIVDKGTITITEQTLTDMFRYYAMNDVSFTAGLYPSIKIRAIGGSIVGGNGSTVHYINGSQVELSNIQKLSAPAITLEVDEVNSEIVIIKFLPITYNDQGSVAVVTDYNICLENVTKHTSTYIDINLINPQQGVYVNYEFDTSELTNGNYRISMMAIAPNSDNLQDNFVINSKYSDKVNITKPGTISNLSFNESAKCFEWDKPIGLEDSNVTYEIYYLVRDSETNLYGNVQKFASTLTSENFYPPNLGTYKIVVVACVENYLKSDYMGTVAYLTKYAEYSNENLRAFIMNYGIEGSNADLFDGGTGTSSDPYIISSVEKFANMKYYSSANFYFKLNRNLGSMGATISFDDLLQLSDTSIAFASASNPFKANFDGGNYTIYLNSLVDNGTAYNGIFAYVDGGKIYNLNIVVANTSSISAKANAQMGIIVGYANNASLSNIAVYANLQMSQHSGSGTLSIYAGGIVGCAEGNSTMTSCRFEGSIGFGDIYEVSSSTLNVTAYVGGIVGMITSSNFSSLPIQSCVNMASLQGTFVGGIVGKTNNGMNKCINMGTVYAIESANTAPICGGLAGIVTLSYQAYRISNSYNKANVVAYIKTSTTSCIGGLIGQVQYTQSGLNTVLSCANLFTTGDIEVNSTYSTSNSKGLLIGSVTSVNVTFIKSYYLYSTINSTNLIGGSVNTVTYTDNYQAKQLMSTVCNAISSYFTTVYSHTYVNNLNTITMSDVSETASLVN